METTYLTPGVMTELGSYADDVRRLPGDFRAIAGVLHGLCIHEFLPYLYDITLTDEDKQTVHLRRAADLLSAITTRDPRPLDVARPPSGRTPTNCRGFTVLAVAMLRAHGVPARARCGFGTYFGSDTGVDHWVVEYQDGDGRWKRGDAQIDAVQKAEFNVDFDLADLPAAAFLTGGEAWELVRAGKADPDTFGLSDKPGEHGDWWIAGNLMRDVAALDNVETLPWDCWSPMPEPGAELDVEFFDRMAAGKEPVTVPDQVYSAVRKQVEPLLTRSPSPLP